MAQCLLTSDVLVPEESDCGDKQSPARILGHAFHGYLTQGVVEISLYLIQLVYI